jgi:DNA replication protein DnaC
VAYARKTKLPELEFLELVLQDEVDRRDHKNLEIRLSKAGFEEEQTLEGFDWDAPVSFDRDRIKELFSLMFQWLHQSRADHSTEKALRRLLAPDLLILDDFGLRRLSAEQSSDLYEVILERHRRASTIVTSNRTIDEWIPLFDDPILAQSALDRLAHNAYQVVMEGESFRKRQRPGERHDDRPAPKPRSRRRRVA